MFKNTLNKLNQINFEKKIELKNIRTEKGIIEFKIGQSYYIKGGTGSGKTTIALQLAKSFIAEMKKRGVDTNNNVKFIHYADLMNLFKSSKTEDLNYLEELSQSTFLIIDDLGVGYGKEHTLVKLERFIDYRMGLYDTAITVFTTNINFQLEENKELQRNFSRILSRITEICSIANIIELVNKDCRVLADAKQFDFKQVEVEVEVVELIQADNESEEDFDTRVEIEKNNGYSVTCIFNKKTKEKLEQERITLINETKEKLKKLKIYD